MWKATLNNPLLCELNPCGWYSLAIKSVVLSPWYYPAFQDMFAGRTADGWGIFAFHKKDGGIENKI